MKFENVEHLWTVDLRRLSRSGQGQVYYERAKIILERAFAGGPLELQGKRIRRSWLCELIGCTLATVSQNRRIRALLLSADSKVADPEDDVDFPKRADRDVSEGAKHHALVSPSMLSVGRGSPKRDYIALTNATCTIDDISYPEIPTIVWPEGIDEFASDWLRYIVVQFGISPSSAEQYAQVLRIFLRLCRQRRRAWTTVDDQFLVLWREHMLRKQRLSEKRVNYCLDVVFAFIVWAEKTGVVHGLVDIHDPTERLEGSAHLSRFPVGAKPSNGRGSGGRISFGWTTPLHVTVPSQDRGKRHTPTEVQVRRIHDLAVLKKHGERDSLLHSWAEETGGRRAELLRLTLDDLPTLDQLDDMIAADSPWSVHIIRKGRKRGQLRPQQDLLIRTLDYVRFERQKIVDDCRKTRVGYSEPREIFLSSATGQVLHKDSLTSLSRRLFRSAGIRKASFHRLRAKHIVEVIDALVEAASEGGKAVNPETILIAAAEELGHANVESLRPYLNYVLNRRTRNAAATKFYDLGVRIRQLELRQQAAIRRLSAIERLRHAGELIRSGSTAEATLELRKIADAIDAGGERSLVHETASGSRGLA